MNFDPTVWLAGALQLLVAWLAICVHESAHGWMAERLGDPTARAVGRISLNPLRHLDPFGTVVLPIAQLVFHGPVFGWGRPSPVLGRDLRRPWDAVWVAAAGPLANLGLAAAAIFAVGIATAMAGEAGREVGLATLQHSVLQSLPPAAAGSPAAGATASAAAGAAASPGLFFLIQLAIINGFMAAFHLLPVPPLDGGEIVARFLPPDWGARFVALRPFGMLVAMALGLVGVVQLVASPVAVALWLAVVLG
jgi:Zn-dependent protease